MKTCVVLEWQSSQNQMFSRQRDALLTGHRRPAGSWAAGRWTAPRWSGGWWACACSAGKRWWTVPPRDGPPRARRWGPWCWGRSRGTPRWRSKCQPNALETGKRCVNYFDQGDAALRTLCRTHSCISSARIWVCRLSCTSTAVWNPDLEPLRKICPSVNIRNGTQINNSRNGSVWRPNFFDRNYCKVGPHSKNVMGFNDDSKPALMVVNMLVSSPASSTYINWYSLHPPCVSDSYRNDKLKDVVNCCNRMKSILW